MKGADYSFARPSMSSLTSLGVRWVGRYLTGTGKALTVPERDELHAAGVGIVAIFEAGASDAIRGAGQGSIDGQQARAAAQALGFPASTVIYWTVDQDTRDLIDVEAYGRAFAGREAPGPRAPQRPAHPGAHRHHHGRAGMKGCDYSPAPGDLKALGITWSSSHMVR